MHLYFYFFKRIFKTCVVIQLIFFITFCMNHIPSFLIKMQGFHFGFQNFLVMLGLGFLEFFNILTITSFILSVLYHFVNDFMFLDLKIFFVQMGTKSTKIFKILLFNCFVYGVFFVINDLFVVPYSNIFLKKKGLEIYKNKIFSSIQPRHIVNVPEINLNVSIAERVENTLSGCLIHLANYQIFFVIQKLLFEKDGLLKLKLYNAQGKIITDYDTLFLTFDKGEIEANTDVITISDKVAFFDLNDWTDFFHRIKILFVSLLIAFFIFILIFSQGIVKKICFLVLFLILLVNAMGFLTFHWSFFIVLYLIMPLYFNRIIRCLDF